MASSALSLVCLPLCMWLYVAIVSSASVMESKRSEEQSVHEEEQTVDRDRLQELLQEAEAERATLNAKNLEYVYRA